MNLCVLLLVSFINLTWVNISSNYKILKILNKTILFFQPQGNSCFDLMQFYVALVNQISSEKKISFFLTALLSDT